MDINAAFPSTYLKAADLQGRNVPVIIEYVEMEDIGGDHKPVIHFKGKERGLVLNKTNASTIAQMHGSDTDGWAGKSITLFASQTDFQGRSVPCIRVRLHQQQPKPVSDNMTNPNPTPADDIPF